MVPSQKIKPRIAYLNIFYFLQFFFLSSGLRWNAPTIKIKLIRELAFLFKSNPPHISMQKFLKSMNNSNPRYTVIKI